MRHGFTLIELMIVIAIIAIIAAIAIPNLFESRVSATEASAATCLKTGVFPAQVQFQAGNYVDNGGSGMTTANGIGDYATNFPALSGATGTSATYQPQVALSLLSPQWDTVQPQVNNYLFVVGSLYENAFCAAGFPADQGSALGRRCFAINTGGVVFATAAATTNPSTLVSTTGAAADVPFGSGYSAAATAGWSVYRR